MRLWVKVLPTGKFLSASARLPLSQTPAYFMGSKGVVGSGSTVAALDASFDLSAFAAGRFVVNEPQKINVSATERNPIDGLNDMSHS
jgi:hypothetical protein